MSRNRHRALPAILRPLPQRMAGREILDDPNGVSRTDLARSLSAMAGVNRFLGGIRSLFRPLRSLVRACGLQRLSILDVGVGNGEVPRALRQRLEREGITVTWTGLDRNAAVLREARRRARSRESSRLVGGDGLALPFGEGCFDVVTSCLTLHHLSDLEVKAFLDEAARVARRAVVMSDLERHPLHYLGARALGATCWRRDPITRYDGPASVLRSFTREELRSLAEQASFTDVTVRRHLPFRLVLLGRTG